MGEDFESLKNPIIELCEGVACGEGGMLLETNELTRTNDDVETVSPFSGITGIICGSNSKDREELVRTGGGAGIAICCKEDCPIVGTDTLAARDELMMIDVGTPMVPCCDVGIVVVCIGAFP